MDEDLKKKLSKDSDGLLTYEYIANHMGMCDDIMPELIDNLIACDPSGQFTVSAARYLNAIDAVQYADAVDRLVKSAIEKDRERRYLPDLLKSLWGEDYADRIDELNATSDNFRRIYKRLYATGI